MSSNLDMSMDPCEDFSRYTCSKLYPDLSKEKRDIGGQKTRNAEKSIPPKNLEANANLGRRKRSKPISLNEINELGGERGKRTNIGEENDQKWTTETEKYVFQFVKYCQQQQSSQWYKTSMDKPEIDYLNNEIHNLLNGSV